MNTKKETSRGVPQDLTDPVEAQISHICKTTDFHLLSIGSVRDLISKPGVEQLIQSRVMSQCDFCNSLRNGVPGTDITS